MSSKQRPGGITILAVLLVIGGVLSILAGLGLMALSSTVAAGSGYTLFGLLTLVLGIIDLGLAVGLWTLQPWAYWGTIVIEVINIVLTLILMLGSYGSSITSLIIPVIVVIYMFTNQNVKTAFGQPA